MFLFEILMITWFSKFFDHGKLEIVCSATIQIEGIRQILWLEDECIALNRIETSILMWVAICPVHESTCFFSIHSY